MNNDNLENGAIENNCNRLFSGKMFFAGAISGIAEVFSVQPLDVTKTRFQLNTSSNSSVFKGLQSIYIEGGFLRFYRGILPELVGMVPKSSVMYATYESSNLYIKQHYTNNVMTANVAFISGLMSGIPEALVVQPFQVVKVKLQSKEYIGVYKNSFDCAKKMYIEHGIKSFTIGLIPTLYRNCVWNSIYFCTMFQIKKTMNVSGSFATVYSGFFAGLIATCFNAPFDLVKSRFQGQLLGTNFYEREKHVLRTMINIYREEGPGALYKGFAAKSLRMAIGAAVGFTVFEAILNAKFNENI